MHGWWSRVLLWPLPVKYGIFGLTVFGAIVGVGLYAGHQMYEFSAAEQNLIKGSTVDKKFIKASKGSISYDRSDDTAAKSKKSVTLAAARLDSTGKTPYRAELATSKGEITFSDAEGQREFKIIPQFTTGTAQYKDGIVTYPQGIARKHVYTFRKNGVKEDIILAKAPGNEIRFSWRLELGNELQAKLMANGDVGIYSANPYLFGNVQVSDDKSQKLIDNARKSGAKTNLAFVLPAPYISESAGGKNYQDVKFSLDGSTLTLTARNLRTKQYPLSIDPSVVVTTTADFATNFSDDGGIDYSVADQISRQNITSGATGSISTSYFSTPRKDHVVVAYNGYLYIMGGIKATSDTICRATGLAAGQVCGDILRYPINPDGSLGALAGTSYFNVPRYAFDATAYNGYLYISGGFLQTADTACKSDTSTATLYCNDIQSMPLDPSTGAPGSISTGFFNYPRGDHRAVASNGYLYIVGGQIAASDTTCKDTGAAADTRCTDIQRYPINPDGSLGALAGTAYYITPRAAPGAVAYNGYFYIIGGQIAANGTICKNTGVSDSQCNDIQRFSISSTDGSLTAVGSTSYFVTPRANHGVVATNGYLYIMGGIKNASDTACKNTGVADTRCNDILRYPINSDGSIGALAGTAYFTTPRAEFKPVATNNFLYIGGGSLTTAGTACKDAGSTVYCNDIQRMPLGMSVPDTNSTSYFTTPRVYAASVAYNGYLYIIGGFINTAGTACKDAGSSAECNDIQRMPINPDGSLGAIITSYFNTPRDSLAAVAYNGYLYIMGGFTNTTSTACKDSGNIDSCNDIQYMRLDPATGAPGTIATSYFNLPKYSLGATAYNGYLYIIGGFHPTIDTACKNTGVSTNLCNDIQYMPLDPTTGAPGTIATSYFDTPREYPGTVAYNGYLYIVGGLFNAGASTNCKNTGASTLYCNDIQRMPLDPTTGAPGTISTSYFNTARGTANAVVSEGYLYVIGGLQANTDTACTNTGTATVRCNDIQRMPINPDGSLGTITTSYFNLPRNGSVSVANGGQVYMIGGNRSISDTNCKNTGVAATYCNDIQRVQVGPANSGPGSIKTSYMNGPQRDNLATVVYNGFLYITGGYVASYANSYECKQFFAIPANPYCEDIQYMPINPDGSLGTINTAYFSTPRSEHSVVAYKGYLYILGGTHPSSDTACVNTGVANVRCNDIQRYPINPDGSIGALAGTSYFSTPRSAMSATAYNGNLYIAAGKQSVSDTSCVNTGVANVRCNDIQRYPINNDGSLGTLAGTSNFTTPRAFGAVAAYNNYFYVFGGEETPSDTACKNAGTNNYCNDIQRFLINPDGSLGTLAGTSYFNVARSDMGGFAYGGYLYVAGGFNINNDTACTNGGSSTQRCNDIQYMPINADGSLGTAGTGYFNIGRTALAAAAGDGNLFIAGGFQAANDTNCKNNGIADVLCKDVQSMPLKTAANSATYEKIVDLGSQTYVSGVSYNGTSACSNGVTFDYAAADNSGAYGATATTRGVMPGVNRTLSLPNTRFLRLRAKLDDASCGGRSVITDITVTYGQPPNAPALLSPTANFVGTQVTPVFTLRTTTDSITYVKYKIDVCSTADCSSIVRTIDQTASQAGWSGQDTQTGTAYISGLTLPSSTVATHTYQGPALTGATRYWWRAYAIDPGITNTWSVASAIQSFTTQSPPSAPALISPPSGATNMDNTAPLMLKSGDPDGDALRYKIEICSASDCSGIVRTIDQTQSQTGWMSQDANNATAYAGNAQSSLSTTAVHMYQSPLLTAGVQYWWRAYAIDPSGSNTWSAASGIQSFTFATPNVISNGGVISSGGVKIGN
jgi:hypothetical protein